MTKMVLILRMRQRRSRYARHPCRWSVNRSGGSSDVPRRRRTARGACARSRSSSAGVLAVPVLAACSEEDPAGRPLAGQDIAPAARDRIADGGTLRWAVDAVPETLNTFQADADADHRAGRRRRTALDVPARRERPARAQPRLPGVRRRSSSASPSRSCSTSSTSRPSGATAGRSAPPTSPPSGAPCPARTPRTGPPATPATTASRRSSAATATWRSGSPSRKPYADWRSLFSPLYPKEVMGTPDAFNDGARTQAQGHRRPLHRSRRSTATAGEVTLTRNPRWWGRPAKLNELVLRAVPRDKRAAALADGKVDIAEIDPAEARRITLAAGDKGRKGASRAHAHALRREGPRREGSRRESRATRRSAPPASRTRRSASTASGASTGTPRSSPRCAASWSASPWSPPTPSSPSTAPKARSPTNASAAPWPAPSTARSSPASS